MAVSDLPIACPEDVVAALCRRNHIRRMSLFGSILRDDFTLESDIDVLVEFDEGYRAGLEGRLPDSQHASPWLGLRGPRRGAGGL